MIFSAAIVRPSRSSPEHPVVTRVPQVFNRQNGITEGVWRDGDVIVKRLRRSAPEAVPAWAPSNDPRAWNYWRRELLAYRTELPERLGLAGPVLVSDEEWADGAEITYEAFGGRSADELDLGDLEQVATVLGLGQGRADLPDDEWLSRGFVRDYSLSRVTDHGVYDDDASWARPLVAPFVDDELRAGLVALHAHRGRLLSIMEALPRTVCHLDLFPNNVFVSNSGIGFIDWSFAGDGAVGEDIGNLVPDSVFDLQLDVADLPLLEERLPAAYIAGLRAAGWRGDDRLVILAIHASAVKYDWLGPRVLARALEDQQTGYGGAEVVAERLFAARFGGLALVARWAREALVEADRLRVF